MGKIPPQANKVFDGVIYDVYQWDQELFNGETTKFEMLKRADTAVVIPTVADKIIVSKQEQPGKPVRWTMLGGRAEGDEDPLTAAKRELKEESGLESSDWELIFSKDVTCKIEWNLHFFIARNCEYVAEPTPDAGEKIELVELDFTQFVEIVLEPDFIDPDLTLLLLREYKENGNFDKFRHRLFPPH